MEHALQVVIVNIEGRVVDQSIHIDEVNDQLLLRNINKGLVSQLLCRPTTWRAPTLSAG